MAKAAELWQRLIGAEQPVSESDRLLLEMQLKFVEARARFLQHDIRLTGMQSDLLSLEELAAQPDVSPESLQGGLRALLDLLDELNATRDLFREALLLVDQQKQLFEQDRRSPGSNGQVGNADDAGAKGIAEMLAEIQRRQQWAERLLTKANALKSTLADRSQTSLRSALTGRSQLPTGSEEWRQLWEHLADTPEAVFYQVTLSVKTAAQTVVQAESARWKLLVAAEVMLLLLTAWFGRLLERGIQTGSESEQGHFISQALLALLQVVRNNLVGIGLVAALLAALWITQVPQPGQGIVAALSLLWIGIKMFLSLVQSLLASLRLSAEQQRHAGVFTRLRWMVVGGGLLGSIVLLTHLSSLPADVSEALDRVFMLYLLLAFPVLLQLRQFLVALLSERYAQRLWFSTLRVATFLLPLALMGAGVLGLVGYLELAWAFAWYLGVFLLVMVGWQITRGVLSDVVVFLKNFAVTHSAYGLLWTQDIIAPLHRVAEVALFVAAWLVFLGFYGLQGEATVFDTLRLALAKSFFPLAAP